MQNNDPYWKAIDELRVRVAQHDAKIAVIEKQIDMVMESQNRIEIKLTEIAKDLVTMTKEINNDLSAINTEISETRGGIRFGKYLLGTGIAIISVVIALAKFFGNGT